MESGKEKAKGRPQAKVYAMVTPELHRLFKTACHARGSNMRERLIHLVKKDLEEMGIRSESDEEKDKSD